MKYILRSFENDNYYYYQDTKQELKKILNDDSLVIKRIKQN